MDVALASIIASGIVAVVALVAPILSTLLSDWLEWKRNKKAEREEKLESAAESVLDKLALVHSTSWGPGWQGSFAKDIADLTAAFYTWARVTSPYCNEGQCATIEKLRERVEGLDVDAKPDTITVCTADAAHSIHEIHQAVLKDLGILKKR